MSAKRLKYHVPLAASDELDRQTRRAGLILERLAAHMAAIEPGRNPDFNDVVEVRHIQQAAESIFGSIDAPQAVSDTEHHCVFVSFSHEDEAFVGELCDRLSRIGVSHFKADRDTQPAAEWAESIWDAIRTCRVVLMILTPRFMKSRWRNLEGGAACASRKPVLTALRYVDASDLSAPFNQFQTMTVENNDQLDALVTTLKQMCDDQ